MVVEFKYCTYYIKTVWFILKYTSVHVLELNID